MNQPRLPALCLALLLLAAASIAGAAPFDLQPVRGTLRPGQVPIIAVSGSWPAGCPPRIERMTLRGRDLVLMLGSDVEDCGLELRPFQVSTGASTPGAAPLQTPGVLRLRLERRGTGAADSNDVLAFRLVEVGQVRRRLPEAGYWWNERGGEFDLGGPGIAILLEPQWPRLGVSVLGYDGEGRPEWQFGAGTLAGSSAEIPLQRLSGGRGPFSDYRQPDESRAVAMLWLEFESAARATAWLVGPGDADRLSLRALSLVRFRFDESAQIALSGRWLLDGLDEAPRALQLRPGELPDAQGFSLIEDRLSQRLLCELDPARPNSPPRRCRLLDGEDAALVEFDDIGLDRMQGQTPDGRPVTALRLPR